MWLIELLASTAFGLLLIYGFMHEEEVAAWEQHAAEQTVRYLEQRKQKFWKRLTRRINRLIRRYEAAHR